MPAETLVPVIERALGDGFDVIGMIEKGLGNASEAEVVKELGGLLGNAKATAYVNAIGQKLVSRTNRKDFGFKFDVIKNAAPNAFALPNGSIYVTDGLLRMLRTEAQLANVLGHEVAHVTKHHTINQIKANLAAKLGIGAFSGIFSRFLSRALSKDDLEASKEAVFELISKGYSRQSESEADAVGQEIARKAGWDPAGMVDVMSIFLSLEKDGRPKGIEAYMRSHPHPEERIKAAQSRLGPPPRGKIGEERYAAFLRDLGVPKSDVKLSPVQAALKYVPGAQPSVAKGDIPWWLPIALGGGALVVIAVLLFPRK
jgi:predicted Zn-dependent protease